MYDEYERALTGKSRQGLSPFGWIVVGAGVVVLVGAVGAGFGLMRVTHRVRQMAREVSSSTAVATARAISHLKDESTSLVSMDPDAGLSFLRGLDSGDPSEALVQQVVGNNLDLPGQVRSASRAGRDASTGSATIHSGDGDVHIDLTRGENGGSLILDSKDGHVRFDLVKNPDGGTLTIHSDDGDARIDLVRGDDGIRLSVHSADGDVDLSVGSKSRRAPGWVPRPDGMPDAAQPVFSLTTPDAILGAIAWKDDVSPGDIAAAYREALETQGYEVQAEHSRSDSDGADASLWARREGDGRTVFLLARRLDGRTRLVLGYGQDDENDR
jgi:hypothetical protein